METRKFDAQIGRVLDLMINALYTNKDIFLRELISNASDACDKLKFLSLQDSNIPADNLKIQVSYNEQDATITIQDNGIGMNHDDMVNNLGTIANSGTKKFLESLGDNQADVNLIGQFGVGFYSAFMVASNVKVISRKANEIQTYEWQSSGSGEYEIGESEEKIENSGTKIVLKLKSSESEYLNKFRLNHIISTYSDHISFPIELVDDTGNTDIVNTRSALWMRPKSEITEDQYKDFYQHISHQPDNPWMRVHNTVEGNLSYTSLLYIPSMKPFDLFHPDRKPRVKLYIKRVFITDETVKLVPQYLRFLRGVVDSEDLPLNISRETVQNNTTIEKIKKSIVKKVLGELKKKAQNETDEYNKFWNNYGEVLKEGLCEPALEEKEQILEICRFHSTHSDQLTSLDEYLNRMLATQEQIYFLTGEELGKLRSHPRLEGFKKRGIEVLLLPEYVDDFWVNVIHMFKNKELKNISNSDIDLDAIHKIPSEPNNEAAKENNHENLISTFKEVLGENVKDVIISKKLVDSASCLSFPDGHMSVRMEKMLIEQKQLKSSSAKILEINPLHPIVQQVAQNKAAARDLVWIVFDQAKILEGDAPHNANEFVTRVNKLLSAAA